MNGAHESTSLTKRVSPTAFTAEQYQQHQEQLALMHREQLEQVQLQQQANSTAAANSTHVSVQANTHTQAAVCPPALSDRLPSTSTSTQGLANTVDQASAQFAASAVITADQLLALKTKEELGPGGGVNGVLSPSGMSTPVTGRDTVSD